MNPSGRQPSIRSVPNLKPPRVDNQTSNGTQPSPITYLCPHRRRPRARRDSRIDYLQLYTPFVEINTRLAHDTLHEVVNSPRCWSMIHDIQRLRDCHRRLSIRLQLERIQCQGGAEINEERMASSMHVGASVQGVCELQVSIPDTPVNTAQHIPSNASTSTTTTPSLFLSSSFFPRTLTSTTLNLLTTLAANPAGLPSLGSLNEKRVGSSRIMRLVSSEALPLMCETSVAGSMSKCFMNPVLSSWMGIEGASAGMEGVCKECEQAERLSIGYVG